jgi:hypothetical protein
MSRPSAHSVAWIATGLALAAIVWHGVLLRIETAEAIEAGKVEDAPPHLAGDAAAYCRLAVETPFPWFSTEREPGIVATGALGLSLFGDRAAGPAAPANHRALRRFGIAFGVGAILALAGVAFLAAGRFAAVVAAFFYADNPGTVFYGAGWLREDQAAALFLAFVAGLIGLSRIPADRRRTRVLYALAAIAAGTGLALLRLESLLVLTFVAAAWAGARALSRRLTREDALLAAGVAAAIWICASPYLLWVKSRTGAAFHPSHAHARFWRNHEFAGRPGFPTREEVERDSYCGPPETPFHYMFGRHSLPEVVSRFARGYAAAAFRYTPRLCASWPWVPWLALPGLAWLLWKRRWEGAWLLAAAALALSPFVFILTLDVVRAGVPPGTGGVEPRFALPILPWIFLGVACTAAACIDRLASRFRPNETDRPAGSAPGGPDASITSSAS